MGDLQSIPLRVAQKKKFEFFFGNFKKTSTGKLSKNIFWASSDHVVAQIFFGGVGILKKVYSSNGYRKEVLLLATSVLSFIKGIKNLYNVIILLDFLEFSCHARKLH